MIAMKFSIELDIALSLLLQAALPQLVTDRWTKLIVVGGPSDRTAIADAALRSRKWNPGNLERDDDQRLAGVSQTAACVRAGFSFGGVGAQGGDGQMQVPRLSTFPGVENVALAPS
jgi:hypothetical protein